jgi:hypothetical protein
MDRETIIKYLPDAIGWAILAAFAVLVVLAMLPNRGGSLDDLSAPAIKSAVDAATAPGEGA